MAWTVPQYPPAKVDEAGGVVRRPGGSFLPPDGNIEDLFLAFEVINNWRSSHAFPLNTFQVQLRLKARGVDVDAIVAQRIKRLPTILQKLRRMESLKLSDVQDIGGCRAIVGNVTHVRELVSRWKASSIKHRLDYENDYIIRPRRSGYRSHHLIYRYYSSRSESYNGLRIEIQIRSALQHAWATAVETASIFTGQSLKNSEGDPEWLKFFALMGSAIAIKEDCPLVERTPSDKDKLYDMIRMYEVKLNAIQRLTAYGSAIQAAEYGQLQGAQYFLLQLDPPDRITITAYPTRDLQRASSTYLAAEKSNMAQEQERPELDTVLVSVDDALDLRRAYPNYFLDTRQFVAELQEAINS